jgi:hypothetical protein
MNKKTILVLAIVALVGLPMAAMGAVSSPTSPGAIEFTLGGYVKMETDWDSTQNNLNCVAPIARSNDPSGQHGRLKFSANNSRFNFTVKGPKVFGATLTGFLEFDCGANSGNYNQTDTTSVFRMRHAMFRLNWPETELMLGQYWGFFSEFGTEVAQDGGLQNIGWFNQRMPQVRVTQKFLGAYTVSAMIAAPTNMYDSANQAAFQTWNAQVANAATGGVTNLPGETSETPQVQLKAAYEADLWGKAAYLGVPKGFTAQVNAGWQRTRYRSALMTAGTYYTFGQDQFQLLGQPNNFRDPYIRNTQYLDPWVVQANLFIPVLATTTANLAGTASILASWYIGAGVDAFGGGNPSNGSYLVFDKQGMITAAAPMVAAGPLGRGDAANLYKRRLKESFGGYVQAQYYFTNQWYLNFVYGMNRAFNVTRGMNAACVTPTNPQGYTIAMPADLYNLWQQYNLTLWYRPIQALKFGVEYAYTRTHWFQRTTAGQIWNGNPANPAFANPAVPGGSEISSMGESHRVMFAGFFYF